MLYLDASALVKLVLREAESAALARYLEKSQVQLSCEIARVEVHRAVRRAATSPLAFQRTQLVLVDVALIKLSEEILSLAESLDPPAVRALDALHVASALSLGQDLEQFVAYDRRLLDAAHRAGLPIMSPGVPQ